jgi:hypothetical protein
MKRGILFIHFTHFKPKRPPRGRVSARTSLVRVDGPLLVKAVEDGDPAKLGLGQAEGIVIWCPCSLIQDGRAVPLDLAAVKQGAFL